MTSSGQIGIQKGDYRLQNISTAEIKKIPLETTINHEGNNDQIRHHNQIDKDHSSREHRIQ